MQILAAIYLITIYTEVYAVEEGLISQQNLHLPIRDVIIVGEVSEVGQFIDEQYRPQIADHLQPFYIFPLLLKLSLLVEYI